MQIRALVSAASVAAAAIVELLGRKPNEWQKIPSLSTPRASHFDVSQNSAKLWLGFTCPPVSQLLGEPASQVADYVAHVSPLCVTFEKNSPLLNSGARREEHSEL